MEEQKTEPRCSPNGCYCGDPESCDGIKQHKKILWCDASKCLWNVPVKPGKHISHHKDWKPLGDSDRYQGICGRLEVGLRFGTIKTAETKHIVTQCAFMSDKALSGHIDFAKLLQPNGSPYGGLITSQQHGMPYTGEAFS